MPVPDKYRRVDSTRLNGLESNSKGRGKNRVVHSWNATTGPIKGQPDRNFSLGDRGRNISSVEEASPFITERPPMQQLRRGMPGRIRFMTNLQPKDFLEEPELDSIYNNFEGRNNEPIELNRNTQTTKAVGEKGILRNIKTKIIRGLRSLLRLDKNQPPPPSTN